MTDADGTVWFGEKVLVRASEDETGIARAFDPTTDSVLVEVDKDMEAIPVGLLSQSEQEAIRAIVRAHQRARDWQ